jgi:hypothetical protein
MIQEQAIRRQHRLDRRKVLAKPAPTHVLEHPY